MSLLSFSQSTLPEDSKLPQLYPAGTIILEEPAVCFSKPQAQIILVDVIQGGISDSIVVNLESQLAVSDSVNSANERVIKNLEEENGNLVEQAENLQAMVDNKNSIIVNNDSAVEVYKEEVKVLKKEVIKQKALKWTGLIVGADVAILTILVAI